MPAHHIYIVGAHSTGKTTLARYIAQRWTLPLVTEVARSVLAEKELQLGTLRTDPKVVNAYQREVFERQFAAEQAHAHESFVSDRSFDNIAYAAMYSTITKELIESETMRNYLRSMADAVIFYIRPHADLVARDGTRSNTNWEDLLAIDGMIKFLLEMSGLRYITIASQKMQERARVVEAVLALIDPAFREAPEQGYIFPETIPLNGHLAVGINGNAPAQ